MKFGDRLTRLRKEKKLTQQEVADKLNISRSAYAGYETGRRVPEYSTLENMANFFDVAIDYLVARTNDKNSDNKKATETTRESVNEAVIRELAMKHDVDLSDPKNKEALDTFIKTISELRK